MALHSHMVPIGTSAPSVALTDPDIGQVQVSDYFSGKPVLVAFLANHCPYVRHVEDQLATLHDEFGQDVVFLGIASNDVDNYPDDGPAGMREQSERAGWTFDYLRDVDQAAAKAFNAACTPDFFLYDGDGQLIYRGAMDHSSPKNGEPNDGALLREALRQATRAEAVPEPHRPSMGCGIKWKPGNEPETLVIGSPGT